MSIDRNIKDNKKLSIFVKKGPSITEMYQNLISKKLITASLTLQSHKLRFAQTNSYLNRATLGEQNIMTMFAASWGMYPHSLGSQAYIPNFVMLLQ